MGSEPLATMRSERNALEDSMSTTTSKHPAGQHHTDAATHHKEAAKHHEQAAGHYEKGEHDKAAEQAHHAHGHHTQAQHHAEEAAKHHATHTSTKK